MSYAILEALFSEYFDGSCDIMDMVDARHDGLDHQNQNMQASYEMAVDGLIALESMYARYQ